MDDNLGISRQMIRLDEEIQRRFWSKVDKSGEHWLWTGGVCGNGYGAFRIDGIQYSAHRIAFLLGGGILAPGDLACHHCDIPLCMLHLFAGSPADNSQDRDRKGRGARGALSGPTLHPERMARGMGHGRAKVTDEQVREIRRAYAAGEASQSQLGTRFGLTQAVIGRIVRGLLWKHIA